MHSFNLAHILQRQLRKRFSESSFSSTLFPLTVVHIMLVLELDSGNITGPFFWSCNLEVWYWESAKRSQQLSTSALLVQLGVTSFKLLTSLQSQHATSLHDWKQTSTAGSPVVKLYMPQLSYTLQKQHQTNRQSFAFFLMATWSIRPLCFLKQVIRMSHWRLRQV